MAHQQPSQQQTLTSPTHKNILHRHTMHKHRIRGTHVLLVIHCMTYTSPSVKHTVTVTPARAYASSYTLWFTQTLTYWLTRSRVVDSLLLMMSQPCKRSCVIALYPLQADKRDPQGATVPGFEVLLQKQLKGKHMQKEMAEFIRERWADALSFSLT